MTGVLHKHPEKGFGGLLLYHRKDGAIKIHGEKHSRHIPALDRQRRAKERPPSRGYPHAGDGAPIHTGKTGRMKPRKINGGGKRR